MGMHMRIHSWLPKTDCRKCGQDTCLAFATELAQRQASLDACPDVTEDARRIVHEIISAERELAASFWGMISGVRKGDVLSALRLFMEVFIMMPVRVISFMLFTFPLSAPLLLLIVWLFMR
jgi:putative Fe-S cluster protein